MCSKLSKLAVFAAAFVSVQAIPQSGEHTCLQECVGVASQSGLPPRCNTNDDGCLGCGSPAFLDALNSCLQGSCPPAPVFTCNVASISARRQDSITSDSAAATAVSVSVLPVTGSGTLFSASIDTSVPPASGSGTLLSASSMPTSFSSAFVGSSVASGIQPSSISGSSIFPGPGGSKSSSASGPSNTNTNTGNGTGGGTSTNNLNGVSSGAMSFAVPLNTVVGAGVAAVAALAGMGIVL
ncbi:hypothetical protein BC835DRAFT_542910 [Cytidiella melzeri]|nr:hypothetical protein BC835DRAFT_542910 [Cytidiella melzeri]